jgi:DNA-binding transcriptional MocR family regulator
MSRIARRNRDRHQRHVKMMHFMMSTAAWKSLDATARAIYIHMAMRYAGPGSNNGRLPYSVREAATELRIGKTTAARALHALVDRGFIVAMQRGAFSWKKRHATEWRLTEFASDLDNSTPPRTLRAGLHRA